MAQFSSSSSSPSEADPLFSGSAPPDPSSLDYPTDSETSSESTPSCAALSGLPPLAAKYKQVNIHMRSLIPQVMLHLRVSVENEKGNLQFLAALDRVVPGFMEMFLVCHC